MKNPAALGNCVLHFLRCPKVCVLWHILTSLQTHQTKKRACILSHIVIYVHSHMDTWRLTREHTLLHTHTYTHMHARTHTYRLCIKEHYHTHTRTYMYIIYCCEIVVIVVRSQLKSAGDAQQDMIFFVYDCLRRHMGGGHTPTTDTYCRC